MIRGGYFRNKYLEDSSCRYSVMKMLTTGRKGDLQEGGSENYGDGEVSMISP